MSGARFVAPYHVETVHPDGTMSCGERSLAWDLVKEAVETAPYRWAVTCYPGEIDTRFRVGFARTLKLWKD